MCALERCGRAHVANVWKLVIVTGAGGRRSDRKAAGIAGSTRTWLRAPRANGWRKEVWTASQSGNAGAQRIEVYSGAPGNAPRSAATTFSDPAMLVSHSCTS